MSIAGRRSANIAQVLPKAAISPVLSASRSIGWNSHNRLYRCNYLHLFSVSQKTAYTIRIPVGWLFVAVRLRLEGRDEESDA